MIFAVLATGPSMSQAVADSVRGRCKVVAVSDAWELAPWADALVSADRQWWREKSPVFHGKRYTLAQVEGADKVPNSLMGTNSGLLGIQVAVMLGAKKVLLFGIDLHGTHYFGPHTGKLKNTSPTRMQAFHGQFASYQPRGIQIINCSPASDLGCYPRSTLEAELESMAES